MTDEDGSTLPLILGFFLVALLLVAGSVAAGDAFVQQRSLQDVCDGAAAEAASTAIDIDRGPSVDADALTFVDVQHAAAVYLAREPSRADVHIVTSLSADAQTLTLRCTDIEHIAFGAMFGFGNGVRHTATSSAQAPLSG